MGRYYSNEEYVIILKELDAYNKNVSAAARAYAVKFPDRRLSYAKTIRRVEQRFAERLQVI